MKLIMENWKRFLKENDAPAGHWLENLKQVAMDYLIANPDVEIADVLIKDIFAHADIDPNMDDEFVRSNLDPEQKSWWLFGAKGINDIHLGAREGAEEEEHVATDMPGAAPGNAPDKGPILREDDDTPRDPGLGLGAPADDEDGLDHDTGYPPEETQAAAIKRANRGK